MKQKTDYFSILNEMMKCIVKKTLNRTPPLKMENLFSEIRQALYNDYFTPFESEDLFLIANALSELYSLISQRNNCHITSENINELSDIVFLLKFYDNKKKKYQLHSKIDSYLNKNIKFTDSFSSNADINNKCNEIVKLIEYTLIKNS